MKIKSIKKHIIIVTIMIVMIPLIIVGVFCCTSNRYSTTHQVEKNMAQSALLAAERVQWELKSFLIAAEETGCNPELGNSKTSDERKLEITEEKVVRYGFERGCVIGMNGIGSDGEDYSDTEFFKNAMNGLTTVTEPEQDKVSGSMSIIVAAPIWDNGAYCSNATGCVFFVPKSDFLNEIVAELKISDNTSSYILDKNGVMIADEDPEMVLAKKSVIALAQQDSTYAELAAVHQKMIEGGQGLDEVKFYGKTFYIGYAPIAETDGWSIAVTAPEDDFMGVANACVLISVALCTIALVISVINSGRMGKKIGDPVALCTERLKLLSEGDLSSPVPQINTADETRVLADATEQLVGDMNSIISDIGRMLDSMANGNFNVSSSCGDGVYKGDFHVLIESVNEINHKLSHTLSQINSSADMVSSGSEQVSGGAQGLAQGATEQASSIEQLTSTVENIAAKVEDTTAHCVDGQRLTDEAAEHIVEASQCMDKLTAAMQDINEASNEISRIIKAIEDIAFQTNILALNAAVEAARAGEAGKGFAVVADEVRNLASKSSEAAQETTALIERAVSAIENGKGITEQTAAAVSDVAKRSEEVRSIVAQIAEASAVQSDMIAQVTQGMEQISGVVQTNSATAEESAAASEELSGQALVLKKLVGGFTLNSED